LTGVLEDRRCRRPQRSPSTVTVEERHADSAFEFGEALRQR
jgi:hypothetical protein